MVQVDAGPLRRRATVLIGVSLLSAALLASLVLMSSAIQNSGKFGAMYSLLLLTNTLGLLLFIVVLVSMLMLMPLSLYLGTSPDLGKLVSIYLGLLLLLSVEH